MLTQNRRFVPEPGRNGSFSTDRQCLRDVRLSPNSGRTIATQRTAASGQKAKSAGLFDHVVGNREERWWDFQAKLLSGLEINRQLEFGRRLHRKLTRRFSFQDSMRR